MRRALCVSAPGWVEPMTPTLVDKPPDGGEWLHEIKYDGYRTQIVIEGGAARAYSRRGYDWTERYWPLVAEAERLSCRSAILDGEVIVTTALNKPDFGAIRTAIAQRPETLVFVTFDLLHLDGQDLRRRPLIERRTALWNLVAPAEGGVQFSQSIEGNGGAFFAAAERDGLEGIVSKRPDSLYRSGPTRDWLKAKCFEESDYEIAGVLRDEGKPAMTLMADRDRNNVGSAFITMNEALRERLWARVQGKAGPAPKGFKPRPGAEWLAPGLIGRVKHLKGEAMLRHATLKDVRDDG